MEGERAFEQELRTLKGKQAILEDNPRIAYKYNLGGGYHVSKGWEPLGLTGYYDTCSGPERYEVFFQTQQLHAVLGRCRRPQRISRCLYYVVCTGSLP